MQCHAVSYVFEEILSFQNLQTDVTLARPLTSKSWPTSTLISIKFVHTSAAILAGIRITLVNFLRAIESYQKMYKNYKL